MSQKPNTAKSPSFSLQTGKDIVTINEAKSLLATVYDEVGMTDWEIHLNKTMLLLENKLKQEFKKTGATVKKVVENLELKNNRQSSDYWLG